MILNLQAAHESVVSSGFMTNGMSTLSEIIRYVGNKVIVNIIIAGFHSRADLFADYFQFVANLIVTSEIKSYLPFKYVPSYS